jgi:hypothetical protein
MQLTILLIVVFFFSDNFDRFVKVILCKKLSVVGFSAKHFYRESTPLDLI